MPAGAPEREIPWGTVILVAAALACHGAVLAGNVATAQAMVSLGQSADGWSDVGLALSESLSSELDGVMTNVSGSLSWAIGAIGLVQGGLDSTISVVGQLADAGVQHYKGTRSTSPLINKDFKNGFKNMSPEEREAALANMPPAAQAKMAVFQAKQDRMEKKQQKLAKKLAKAHTSLAEVDAAAAVTRISLGPAGRLEELRGVRTRPSAFSNRSLAWKSLSENRVLARAHINVARMLRATSLPGALPFGQPLDAQSVIALAGDVMGEISRWDVNAMSLTEFKEKLRAQLQMATEVLLEATMDLLGRFLETIEPALVKVAEWLDSFGGELQGVIFQFSVALDRVQKIFDQAMSHLSRTRASDSKMREYTFHLFDPSNTGGISVKDLHRTARMFGITALAGSKSVQLFEKHLAPDEEEIGREQFKYLIHDSSMPGLLEVVLRLYAKKLSVAAGNLAAGVMLEEVADAVAQWVSIATAAPQSRSKVRWVAARVTNASLPLPFAGALLRSLARNARGPEEVSVLDVGLEFIKALLRANANYTTTALSLLSNVSWWDSEGFDVGELPETVEKVTGWVTSALDAQHQEHVGKASDRAAVREPAEGAEGAPAAARRLAEASVREWRLSQTELQGAAQHEFFSSFASQALRDGLLGGSSATGVGTDPEMRSAQRRGNRAAPETLEFARFLSWNTSQQADMYEQETFGYASTSSSSMDSFAGRLQAVVKKVQAFLNIMRDYSEPPAIMRLGRQVRDFGKKAVDEMVDVAMDFVHLQLLQAEKMEEEEVEKEKAKEEEKANELKIGLVKLHADFSTTTIAGSTTTASSMSEPTLSDFSVSWSSLLTTLATLQQALPGATDGLAIARKEASGAAATLRSTFGTFKAGGPPVFDRTSGWYRTLWTVYFVLFAVLTGSVLFYAFWSAGFCRGEDTHIAGYVDDYEPPTGFLERCRVCFASCNACMKTCHSDNLAFWSYILLIEAILLLLFLASVGLAVFAGVRLFVASGCAEIYVLGDRSVCSGVFNDVRQWLPGFWQDEGLEHVCDDRRLLTCDLIGGRMAGATTATLVGSLLAAALSFQLLANSAIQHERERWRATFEEESKKV